MGPAKRVAVIGLGPAGAITIDALLKEECFDVVRGFERREGVGGCWNQEANPTSPFPYSSNLSTLSTRTESDLPLSLPESFPICTQKAETRQPRHAESSVYPYLETNVSALAMEFSQEPFPTEVSPESRRLHGSESPFRHWRSVKGYIESIAEKNIGGEKGVGMVEFNTTVEMCEKVDGEWRLVLRRENEKGEDFWWEERFDAVVVASGHWSVPYVPFIPGLEDFEREKKGRVLHSKHFRGREAFKGKHVVVVGASVSAADISTDLIRTAILPVHSVVLGHSPNTFFGDIAFQNPQIQKHPTISHISPETQTVHFIDGSSVEGVDHIIFGTGYSWTLPFLPQIPTRNNRVPDLYQHVIYRHDPSLLFIGAVGPGLTFKIFEWQAVLAARILADRTTLPDAEVMKEWEEKRIEKKGDGPRFTLVWPDLEEYFEEVRELAGEGFEGKGRKLVKFRKEWMEEFGRGVDLRIGMWKRGNGEARRRMEADEGRRNEKGFERVNIREVEVDASGL